MNKVIEKIADENLNIGEDDHKNEDDIINNKEQYLINLQRRINDLRKERKQAQNDSNLLENRLNLLREEEKKVYNN